MKTVTVNLYKFSELSEDLQQKAIENLYDLQVIKYATGRNSERFTDFDKAKEYADKWKDKSISVYVNGLYHSTIHKKDGVWEQ